jgi:hypothetical protein
LISCFPGTLLGYFLNGFEMVPVALIITGITFVFTLHMQCISIAGLLLLLLLLLLLFKDTGVQLDSKLHFHAHADYLFSPSLRNLGLIRLLTYSFSTLECLLLLYSTLVRPKLQYASVVWN